MFAFWFFVLFWADWVYPGHRSFDGGNYFEFQRFIVAVWRSSDDSVYPLFGLDSFTGEFAGERR